LQLTHLSSNPLNILYCSSYDYEVIVIDDNSPDGTQDVVRQLQQVYGRQKLLLCTRAGKLGLGSAYVYGLQVSPGSMPCGDSG
jgi:glycosyltransferase involved in cell wall biosynthesis